MTTDPEKVYRELPCQNSVTGENEGENSMPACIPRGQPRKNGIAMQVQLLLYKPTYVTRGGSCLTWVVRNIELLFVILQELIDSR